MIIYLFGKDGYRLQRRLRVLLARYSEIAGNAGNVLRWDGRETDPDELKQVVGTPSLFKEKRFFLVSNALDQSGLETFLQESGEKVAQDDDVILVLVHEGEPDKRNKLSQQLSGLTEHIEHFPLLEGVELQRMADTMAKEKGLSMDPQARSLLLQRVGNDLWRMENDIAKLTAYAKDEKPIRTAHIELLVEKDVEAQVFETIDEMAKGNRKAALERLRYHETAQDSPVYVLSMFLYQVRSLLALKYSQEHKGASGLSPYVERKLQQAARRFTLQELKELHEQLFDIERSLKTGEAEGFQPLESFIFQSSRLGERP